MHETAFGGVSRGVIEILTLHKTTFVWFPLRKVICGKFDETNTGDAFLGGGRLAMIWKLELAIFSDDYFRPLLNYMRH